jgi:hypothetical protein
MSAERFYGLIELLLVFGAVMAWALWQWWQWWTWRRRRERPEREPASASDEPEQGPSQ